MLGKVFARFVEQSPISVMVRGTLERVLGAGQLDAWLARTAQKQYTRTVLCSPVYDILSHVVFRIKPAMRAADQDHQAQVGTSLISLYNSGYAALRNRSKAGSTPARPLKLSHCVSLSMLS